MEARLSPYIITLVAAWLISHTIKFFINLSNNEHYSLKTNLSISGGMPSGHSATTVAMATIIGLRDGLGSGIFGLAVLFACIVMYDAFKVRRSSGEQGLAIQQLIKESKSQVNLPRAAKGHTPLEVFVGAILGVVVGVVVFLSTI